MTLSKIMRFLDARPDPKPVAIPDHVRDMLFKVMRVSKWE